MALPDPQSVTLAAAVSLPRIVTNQMSSEYISVDGATALSISHQTVRGRRRSLLRVMRKKISVNVLTDVKSEINATVSIVIDRPSAGFTEVELIELVTGQSTWLTAGVNANAKRLLGMES